MTKTVTTDPVTDPVTFEVIRHRLMAITDEQGATLAGISGSPHVVEASDYNVGLYLPDGSVAAMGRTIMSHASAMAAITRAVIEDCTPDPGIGPGDMFVVNDPWKGTVHAQDVGVLAPIFYQGELLAWTGAMCHMVDIGGMSPGSFCVDATDCFQEGLQLPPVKLIEAGRVRTDVWNLILAHTRMPNAVNLDLRGLVAANNTAVRAVTALADRYGADTVRAVMAGLIALSEMRLRARLAELPDARMRATAYLDNDGGLDDLFEVSLVLTKRGDSLHFDYSGSSPQVAGYVNCTLSGLMAGVAAALLPTFAYDAPWNQGLFNPVEVHAPEGLICNARRPAAVSGGALEACWLVEMTAIEALSKLAVCSPALLREAQATPAGGPDKFVLTGAGTDGRRQTYVIMDCLATGGGAYEHRDGVWTQGQHNIERQRIANVETVELDTPMLYLWRGLVPDSGGAGRRRGGLSMGAVYLMHGGRDVVALNSAHGWEVPNSTGIFGGYPGAQNDRVVVTGGNVADRFAAGDPPVSAAELAGERPVMRGRQGSYPLVDGDVLATVPQAGGGWGDPLSRPVTAVQSDVDHAAVTSDAAVRLYGVVLGEDGRIDEQATDEARARVRADRRAWPAETTGVLTADDAIEVHPLGDQLRVLEGSGRRFVGCRCGHVLAPAERPWRLAAGLDVSTDITDVSSASRFTDELELRRYACPGCGVLLATDVVRRGAEHRHDIEFLTGKQETNG